MVSVFVWEDERAVGCGTMLYLTDIPCGSVIPIPDPFEFVINLDPLLCSKCEVKEEQFLLAKVFPYKTDSV